MLTPPLHERKAPPTDDFLTTVLAWTDCFLLFYDFCCCFAAAFFVLQWQCARGWKSLHCCNRKSRAACAQSFAPWQQATIEIARRDHSIIACSCHISFYGCYSSRTSRSWWIAHSTQRQLRGCNTTICIRPTPFEDSCTTREGFSTTFHKTSEVAGYYRRWKNCFCWHYNTNCYTATIVCLDAEGLWEPVGEFHVSWDYTFSAMLSALRNWTNHDRYRLRPSTPAQQCWSSSRLQPHQYCNPITPLNPQ